jgi:hypothetical protein
MSFISTTMHHHSLWPPFRHSDPRSVETLACATGTPDRRSEQRHYSAASQDTAEQCMSLISPIRETGLTSSPPDVRCHASACVWWVRRSRGGNRLTSVRSSGRTVSGTNTVSASLRTSLARRSEGRWIGSGRERPLCAAAVSRSRSATAPGPMIGIQ